MKPICKKNSFEDKIWRLNGNLHRVDGPAIEKANGDKQWWINDEKIDCESDEEFEDFLLEKRKLKLIAFL